MTCAAFSDIVCRLLVDLPSEIVLHLDPPACAPALSPNEATDFYYKSVFHSFPTWEEQLNFFVQMYSRRPPLAPLVVVARYCAVLLASENNFLTKLDCNYYKKYWKEMEKKLHA